MLSKIDLWWKSKSPWYFVNLRRDGGDVRNADIYLGPTTTAFRYVHGTMLQVSSAATKLVTNL